MKPRNGNRLIALASAAFLVLALTGLAACASHAVSRLECSSTGDCEGGSACVDGVCRTVCIEDRNCPTPIEECVEGTCREAANPSCSSAGECAGPATCNDLVGAVCAGGRCSYPSAASGKTCDDGKACTTQGTCDGLGNCVGQSTCNTPPANRCINGDSTFQAFPQTGECAADGQCTYTPTEKACADCLTQCLAPCLSLDCPDRNGGCQRGGTCVLAAPGSATCEYQTAADGIVCDLAGLPTNNHAGICLSGSCVDCLNPLTDCTMPPSGVAACYAPSCAADHSCNYGSALTGTTCAPGYCSGGTAQAASACNASGACVAGGTSSCDGHACNPAGTQCLLSCTNAVTDCLAGRECTAGHDCVLPGGHGNGELCAANSECTSNLCDCNSGSCSMRYCSSSSCPCQYDTNGAGTCDGSLDLGVEDVLAGCNGLHACANSACKLKVGSTCTADNACISGTCDCSVANCGSRVCSYTNCPCQYNSDGSGNCDGNLDAGVEDVLNYCTNSNVCGGGSCKLGHGGQCTGSSQCVSNNCACALANTPCTCFGSNCICQ